MHFENLFHADWAIIAWELEDPTSLLPIYISLLSADSFNVKNSRFPSTQDEQEMIAISKGFLEKYKLGSEAPEVVENSIKEV
jgi:hypothetical protein